MPETEIAAARRIRELQEWQRFLLHDSSVLKTDPSLLFQQAANQPDGTAPARAAQDLVEKGLVSRPWIRWVNKESAAGPLVMTITGHADSIVSCAFSRDDRTISTASFDGDIRFWDVETGRESRRLADLRYGLKACSFSPCGTRLAALNQLDKTVELRNAVSGETVASTPGHLVSRFSQRRKALRDGAQEGPQGLERGHRRRSSRARRAHGAHHGLRLLSRRPSSRLGVRR